MSARAWQVIFETYGIAAHDFDAAPFFLSAQQIKQATADLQSARNADREPRLLCYQATRESRPQLFQALGLFVLPVTNGDYALIRGEGYADVPPVDEPIRVYRSQLGFALETAQVGNSEMQHLDYAYATSLVRTFLNDDSLVLTIRGRKRTPAFSFFVGQHRLDVAGVQTEVDAGFEGREQVVLVEAKNAQTSNTIIKQLYYPYRQWMQTTRKRVRTLFFEKRGKQYAFWEFVFDNPDSYNSVGIVNAQRYEITEA